MERAESRGIAKYPAILEAEWSMVRHPLSHLMPHRPNRVISDLGTSILVRVKDKQRDNPRWQMTRSGGSYGLPDVSSTNCNLPGRLVRITIEHWPCALVMQKSWHRTLAPPLVRPLSRQCTSCNSRKMSSKEDGRPHVFCPHEHRRHHHHHHPTTSLSPLAQNQIPLRCSDCPSSWLCQRRPGWYMCEVPSRRGITRRSQTLKETVNGLVAT